MNSMHDIDQAGTRSAKPGGITVCRTIGCDRDASGEDEFCPRCREEIDAVRVMAQRRFVIWGAYGMKRAAGRQG
jgi:hypothetical protein